jgi:hypothetical protein
MFVMKRERKENIVSYARAAYDQTLYKIFRVSLVFFRILLIEIIHTVDSIVIHNKKPFQLCWRAVERIEAKHE